MNTRRSQSVPFLPRADEILKDAEETLTFEQLETLYDILAEYECIILL